VLMDTGVFTGEQTMSEEWHRFREFVARAEELPVSLLVRRGCHTDPGDEVGAAYDAPFPSEASKAGARAFPAILPTQRDAPGAEAGRRTLDALREDGRPMLILWGDQDPVLPPRAGEALASAGQGEEGGGPGVRFFTAAADGRDGMGSVVRICAVAAAALVALSFAFFAVDQLTEGSENQVRAVRGDNQRAPSQAQIDKPAPDPAVERIRETQHSRVREYVDDANDILLSPFTGLVDTEKIWSQRVIPGLLALLLYGLGGTILANAMPKPNRQVGDWRESTS